MRAAFVLLLSLALTGALLVMNAALYRQHGGLPGFGAERKVTVTTRRVVRPHPPAARALVTISTNAPFHWSALESPDYAVYAANLRAVGCPDAALRDILLADIEKLYADRAHALTTNATDTFWETADQRAVRERQRQAQDRALELEKRALIQRLLGQEWSYEAHKITREAPEFIELLLGFVNTSKADRLVTAYELRGQDAKAFLEATDYLLLDEDFPQLQAVRDRFEHNLAATVSQSEFEELRLRLAGMDRFKLPDPKDGFFRASAGEAREMAKLFTDTHDILADLIDLNQELHSDEQRAQADAAHQASLRRYLGAERYADYQRSQDSEFRELFDSTEKRGVTKAALTAAYETRTAANEQARELQADQQLSAEERTLLQAALLARTTQALARDLGQAAFAAYLKDYGEQLTNSLAPPPAKREPTVPVK